MPENYEISFASGHNSPEQLEFSSSIRREKVVDESPRFHASANVDHVPITAAGGVRVGDR